MRQKYAMQLNMHKLAQNLPKTLKKIITPTTFWTWEFIKDLEFTFKVTCYTSWIINPWQSQHLHCYFLWGLIHMQVLLQASRMWWSSYKIKWPKGFTSKLIWFDLIILDQYSHHSLKACQLIATLCHKSLSVVTEIYS